MPNAYVWCALDSAIAEISTIKVQNGMEWILRETFQCDQTSNWLCHRKKIAYLIGWYSKKESCWETRVNETYVKSLLFDMDVFNM